MKNYKFKMLDEYRELIRKRTRLEEYLDNQKEVSNKYEQLLREQLEVMLHYEEVLFKRIIIEMGEEI